MIRNMEDFSLIKITPIDYDIPTTLAYRRYVASKPWAADNYLRKPERRPVWIVSTNSGIADFILV